MVMMTSDYIIVVAVELALKNGDMTAVPRWSEQPHYKHHSIRLKCEKRVTCLLQWKGGRMSV